MKHKCTPLVCFLIILISFPLVINNKINSEELSLSNYSSELESDLSNLDSDDMILKMKSFFDTYADKLKNNMKGVDKIILPSSSTSSSNNQKNIYSDNYNLDEFKKQNQNFIDETTQMRQNDLKTQREAKQSVEENYIDLITKNKIMKSRVKVGNGESNIMTNDYKEKENIKTNLKIEMMDIKNNSEKIILDNLEKLKIVKKRYEQYDNRTHNLKFNQEVFEDDIKIQNNLENLKTQIFKADFESQFFTNLNSTKTDFIKKASTLNQLFKSESEKLQIKISVIEDSIQNKTDIIKRMKQGIEDKYIIYENLNNTINKLQNIQTDYKNALRDLEENLNRMKSKKSIIEENILDKKKRMNIRKKTIDGVLHNLEKELEKFNVDRINVNKYRKDISNINTRLKRMLFRENMIFNKNKIKI